MILVACSTDPGISSSGSAGGGGTTGSGSGGSGSPGSAGAPGSTTGNKGGTSGSGAPGGSLGFNMDAGVSVKGGSTGGEGTPGSGEGKTCGFEKFELERNPPELLLVQDRSSSMNMKDTRLTTRWDEVVPAISATVTGTTADVYWALKFFPTVLGCMVTPGVEVEMGLNNATAMLAAITGSMLVQGTPTPDAIKMAFNYLKARTTKNPKFIVLATDGEPDCDYMKREPKMATMNELTMAAAAGIKTFVVGIATQGGPGHATLNMMADAGGTARMGDPRYYAANNRQQLIDALKMITTATTNCVFPLSKAPPTDNAAVKIDGVLVMKDPADGWSYGAANMSILLNGTSCARLKMSLKAAVSITFDCPNVIID